jgi:transcriptional regulator with XRE-family HTH domain
MHTQKIDPDKIATLVRAVIAVRHIKQTELAKCVGIHRVMLNMFLNRKVNLLPEQIDLIIAELGLEEAKKRLIDELNLEPLIGWVQEEQKKQIEREKEKQEVE